MVMINNHKYAECESDNRRDPLNAYVNEAIFC